MTTPQEEIREAIRCFDWYRGPRVISGDANPTSLSIQKAEEILIFHAERFARKLEEGDAANCFWLGKDGDTRPEGTPAWRQQGADA